MVTNRPDSETTVTPPEKRVGKSAKAKKPIAPIRQRLLMTWLAWLVYRLIALPVFISVFNPSNTDIVGCISWQLLCLVQAFIMTT